MPYCMEPVEAFLALNFLKFTCEKFVEIYSDTPTEQYIFFVTIS